MKSNNKCKALGAFRKLGAVVLMVATLAVFFVACNQKGGGGNTGTGEGGEKPKPAPKPKHAITFSVDGANGTLTAKVDEGDIASGKEVEKGKEVTFTATPANANYQVKGWTLDGNAITEAGKNTEYKLRVTNVATVKVSFELMPGVAILMLATDKNTVLLKAKTGDDSAIRVEGCTVDTFNSDNQTELQANGATVTLKGKITELHVIGSFGNKGPLTAIDVSGLAKLKKLNCDVNQLTSLNVQGCTALQELNCTSNHLTTLDVSGLTKLQKLDCVYNQTSYENKTLTELNVQGCTALETLNCYGNKLTELDVQSLTGLKNLVCNQNKLNSLNVKGLTKLKKLNCGENKLNTLNVQGCTALQELDCSDNQLTALDVQSCTSLKSLLCYSNKLSADAFINLFNTLPTRNAGDNAYATLYTEETDKTEGNCKNFSTPEDLKTAFNGAKTKNWTLKKVTENDIEEITL